MSETSSNEPTSAEVLFVDDEESIREAVYDILLASGFSVDLAVDGRDALEKLKINKYRLVLSDISMPNMSGLELLENTRALGLSVGFVMMTAFDDKERLLKALRLGVIDYVVKPFNIEKLTEKLGIWLDISRRMDSFRNLHAQHMQEGKMNSKMLDLLRLKNDKLS